MIPTNKKLAIICVLFAFFVLIGSICFLISQKNINIGKTEDTKSWHLESINDKEIKYTNYKNCDNDLPLNILIENDEIIYQTLNGDYHINVNTDNWEVAIQSSIFSINGKTPSKVSITRYQIAIQYNNMVYIYKPHKVPLKTNPPICYP